MPELNDKQLERLQNQPQRTCRECGQEVFQNYCRGCDLYFSVGHTTDCRAMSGPRGNDHRGHRTY